MLPSPFRLTDTNIFPLLFRSSRRATFRELSVLWLPNNLSHARVACIASKKLFPKAVDRNRAKRLLREALHPLLFQLRPGFDSIVIYRFRPEKGDASAIAHSVRSVMENAQLLNTHS